MALRDSQCSASGNALFIEEPPADLPALVAEWRKAGVSRLVCGFLPDEVAWTASGWDDEFAWFIAHWEFLPFRFSERAAAGRAECVALAIDSSVGVESLCEVIAQAWADAAGLKLARLDLARCDDATAASTLARAALVVNDVQDWSLGFAIDELAARLGRPVLRLRQPGYSPLRHALLGQLLPATEIARDQSLRALLADPLAAARKRLLPYGNLSWFAGGTGPRAWQALYGQPAMDAFWPGMNWKAFRGGTAADARHWTNRVVGWAALAAAARQADVPGGVRDLGGATVARWIVAELRGRVAGPVRELALPRWVRWNPEWIAQYSSATEANPILRGTLVGWVGRSAGLGSFGEPLLAVVRAATSAVDSAVGKRTGWALVLAWAEDWGQVAERAKEAGPISPWLRSLSATAFFGRLGERGGNSAGELEPLLLADDATWTRSFGAAALAVRAYAETRAGRVVKATRVLREWLQPAGLFPTQGILRLVRAAFPTRDDWVGWVSAAAAQETGVPWLSLVAVVERWYPRRIPLALPRSRTPQVQQELKVAIAVLQAVVGGGKREGRVLRLLAVLCAVDGAEVAACTALAGYAAVDPAPGIVAYSVAVLLWYRGAKSAPAELVAQYPERAGDADYLIYLRALAAQLVGDLPLAARMLQRLARQAPGFFQDERATDARWVWTAIVLRLSGHEVAAAALRPRAVAVSASHGVMIDETSCGAAPLAEGWLDVQSRVHEAAAPRIPERIS